MQWQCFNSFDLESTFLHPARNLTPHITHSHPNTVAAQQRHTLITVSVIDININNREFKRKLIKENVSLRPFCYYFNNPFIILISVILLFELYTVCKHDTYSKNSCAASFKVKRHRGKTCNLRMPWFSRKRVFIKATYKFSVSLTLQSFPPARTLLEILSSAAFFSLQTQTHAHSAWHLFMLSHATRAFSKPMPHTSAEK